LIARNLVADLLDNARKPIRVTDGPGLAPALVEKVEKINAVALVECDPAEVDGCVRQIGKMKAVVGRNKLLIFSSPLPLDIA
jgi:hypothetical protein